MSILKGIPRRILSPKQERFCLNYITCDNGTQAVIKAGYDCKDESVAQVIGSDNLSKPLIAARIAALRAAVSKAVVERAAASIMSIPERQELLTDIGKAQKGERPGVAISAIAELNKMDHVYEAGTRVQVIAVPTFIFQMPDGTQVTARELKEQGES